MHGAKGSIDPRKRRSSEQKELQEFRKRFNRLLKDEKYSRLSGWKPVPLLLVASAIALMILSVISRYVVNLGVEKKYVLCIECLVVGISVVIVVHRTLGDRASLLYNEMAEMDDQFAKLVKTLKETSK